MQIAKIKIVRMINLAPPFWLVKNSKGIPINNDCRIDANDSPTNLDSW